MITITGDPKEIAALVAELQGRRVLKKHVWGSREHEGRFVGKVIRGYALTSNHPGLISGGGGG